MSSSPSLKNGDNKPVTMTADDAKSARMEVEKLLDEKRCNPLWFLNPSVWALRKKREELKQAEQLQKQQRKEAKANKPAKPKPMATSVGEPVADATLIITAAEINDCHGTGVLLRRIFKDDPDFIHVWGFNLYGGETSGKQRIFMPPGSLAHADLPALLQGSTIKRILAVPYHRSDVENTLALHELTGAPMCVWLMDHNLGDDPLEIPGEMMKQLLDRAQVRLGISPEFCTLYAGLFGHEIHFAPPVVEHARGQFQPLELKAASPPAGVLLGNVWSVRWLAKLAEAIAEAGLPFAAYGHNSPQWVKHEALSAHVNMRGFLPEDELMHSLRSHPFAVVPTGTLDEDDDIQEIARYSLPSRTLYLSAVGNLPIIVIGHEDSGVARFVKRYGLGLVVPYDGAALRRAVEQICLPEEQLKFRQRAAQMASSFACDDMLHWLWQSLESGRPADDRWSEARLSTVV